MAFTLSPAVQVERDVDGRVRGLNHSGQQYGPLPNVLNARQLAERYVKDVAEIYGIESSWLEALNLAPAKTVEDAATQLRFVQQSAGKGALTVGFQQTHFGLPVWQGGFTVGMLSGPLRATSSLSTLHDRIDVSKPSTDAKCLAGRIKPGALREILNLRETKQDKRRTVVNSQRQWIYRYRASKRLPETPPRIKATEQVGLLGSESPTLPLGPVDERIVDGRHYVATEVLFELSMPHFPELHWRAFVEVDTCSVLYLRALIDACTGSVYLRDPLTETGDPSITACSPASDLDPLRTDVTLEGLTPASPQGLTGSYVTIEDDSSPAKTPPTVTPPPCDFSFSVPSNDFAAVNAYHHVDELFRLVESFGYSPVTDFFGGTTFPVPVYFFDEADVNAHAWPNASATGLGKLTFGFAQAGCPVGIATDWRVVMHEFVHGMLDDRIHNGFLGFAHNGGDGFAAVYMDPGSQAPDRFLTFPWIPLLSTPSDPGNLRRHDRAVADGWAWGGTEDLGSYLSEQILSTTLFRAYRSTGGDSAYLGKQRYASRYVLSIMTHAMASLPLFSTVQPTAVSYAQALMNADAGLPAPYVFGGASSPGGTIAKVVRWSFMKQGLYQPAGAPSPVTSPGAPPEVDVYIDDGRHGEYEYLENFWETTDIWNLLAPDPGTVPTDHQTPIAYQPNYAYVNVKNRGTQSATNVVVSGYHCRPSVGLLWPDDWQAMTTASINVPGTIAPGDTVRVGPFEWTPSTVGHECMLMSVSATGDLSNVDTASGLPCATGPTPHWRLVPFDNNIGQRNVAPVAGGGGLTALAGSFGPRHFWVNNPYSFEGRVELEASLPKFLVERGWRGHFANPGGASFTLVARDSREVLFKLEPGSEFSAADVREAGPTVNIVVRALVNGIPLGGMTYVIDPHLKAPPEELPGGKGRKDCADEAKYLLECLSVPAEEVESVRIKRVVLEIDLKTDCD